MVKASLKAWGISVSAINMPREKGTASGGQRLHAAPYSARQTAALKREGIVDPRAVSGFRVGAWAQIATSVLTRGVWLDGEPAFTNSAHVSRFMCRHSIMRPLKSR
jgi:hypothetical protein